MTVSPFPLSEETANEIRDAFKTSVETGKPSLLAPPLASISEDAPNDMIVVMLVGAFMEIASLKRENVVRKRSIQRALTGEVTSSFETRLRLFALSPRRRMIQQPRLAPRRCSPRARGNGDRRSRRGRRRSIRGALGRL